MCVVSPKFLIKLVARIYILVMCYILRKNYKQLRYLSKSINKCLFQLRYKVTGVVGLLGLSVERLVDLACVPDRDFATIHPQSMAGKGALEAVFRLNTA